MSVDLLTHAFSVLMVFRPLESPLFIAFGVTGTLLPDADILFRSFSDKNPGLYIFSHGGITHSIPGAILLAIVSFVCILILDITGVIHLAASPEFWLSGLAMVLAGSILHITLDYLAYPGIPLLYPVSDRKYTLGIFPGPSLFLLAVSVIYFALLLTGVAGIAALSIYAAVFFVFLVVNIIKKIIVIHKFGGQTIPAFNPFVWLLVTEEPDFFMVRKYSMLHGINEKHSFQKREGLTEEELDSVFNHPEIKRVRYFSYFTVAERKDDKIRVYDPLREQRLIFYPPFYRSASVGPPGS
ncbi:MAG TPA: metal-dependent hydrolase [Methanoregulaceae archaeon]|nr:metal-dependent hydrolase [Methanoregulaceae archaeon]